MINIKRSLLGCLLVSAAVSAAIILPAGPKAEAASVITQKSVASQTGVIQGSVKLRDKPSMSSEVLGYLKNGEEVTILEKSTTYFYKIKTSTGKVGYTSTADQYITVKSGSGTGSSSPSRPDNGSGSNAVNPAPVTPPAGSNANAIIEQVIQTGMKYLGTPYEYGSDRNQTNTFDCSAFTRQIFKEAAKIVLPADSRQQGTWIKEHGDAVYNVDNLKRGDLVFFKNYEGSNVSSYQGINPDQERITHVAVYLGDGKLLHTYSEKAGGVVVTDFSNAWKLRFLYGGSVLK
ncbi:SH3 domain-containing protein [Paenibacillus sp. HJL G12]|uniref:SH3 domain-containing protein n=1 Tax=Paenibacillus dendrobii TaxID=2691084 RepID=A0A7X3LIT8_9BACL|nr:C40 family peptidase [Paenibacillus dendrobii]MWV47331.1 SH3 domain-containing protein [Paenibacillus dendrobii]